MLISPAVWASAPVYGMHANSRKLTSQDEAVHFLQIASAKFPESTVLRNYLGHSLLQLDRLQEAKAVYDDAIRIAPDYGNLSYMRGGIAWRLGDPDVIQTNLSETRRAQPN